MITAGYVEQNNRLISEFMGGVKFVDHDLLMRVEHHYYKFFSNFHKPVRGDKLKYHSSWAWLMPVVTKIEKEYDYFWVLQNIGIEIYAFALSQYPISQIDEDLELPEGLVIMTDGRADQHPQISAVYRGVVQFIKYQNQCKE